MSNRTLIENFHNFERSIIDMEAYEKEIIRVNQEIYECENNKFACFFTGFFDKKPQTRRYLHFFVSDISSMLQK